MRQVDVSAPARPLPSPVVEQGSRTATAISGARLKAAILAGYVFLLPVQIPLGPDRRLAVSDLFVVLYLLVTSFGLRRMKGAWSVWYPALLAVIGLGMLVALGTTHAVSGYAVVQKAFGLVVLLLSMACLVDFFTTVERIRWMLRVFLAGVLLNVVVALAAFVVQLGNPAALPQVNYVGTRLSGFLVDPNAFGGVVACALMLHLFTTRTRMAVVPARVSLLATGVLSVGLILTFSRSAWIAATLGIVVAVVAAGRWAARAVMPLIVGVAVAVPVLAAVYVPDLGSLASRPNQIGDRVSIISESLHEFVGSPLWGIGLGVFPQRHGVIVHNTTVWFLAEMGLVGLFVFVGFVTSFAMRLTTLMRDRVPAVRTLALAALAAHAAMLGLSVGIESLYQRQWWLVFAVGGALTTFRGAERR